MSKFIFKFKEDKVEITIIDSEMLEHYLNELLQLLLEILNPTIAFEEKLN